MYFYIMILLVLTLNDIRYENGYIKERRMLAFYVG